MGAAAKHVFLVTDPTKLEATVRSAFEIARTGRPGPVVVDVPKDVQNWTGSFKGEGRLSLPDYRACLREVYENFITTVQQAAFFYLLRAAKRPLIYDGGAVTQGDCSVPLTTYTQTFSIPDTTTTPVIGCFETTEP